MHSIAVNLDITSVPKPGKNTLDFSIVSTWVNRLIEDSKLPEKERKAWVNVNSYNSYSPLELSGLLGPVLIKSVDYK